MRCTSKKAGSEPCTIQAITRHTYRQAARVLARAFIDEPVSQRVYRRLTPRQTAKKPDP